MLRPGFRSKTSFKEKIIIFSHEYLECCTYLASEADIICTYNESLYSKLASSSKFLDNFLNYHRAINSTQWQLYTAMCSMTTHFAVGAYWQGHVIRCKIADMVPKQKYFSQQAQGALSFFNNALFEIATRALGEAKKLDIPISRYSLKLKKFPSIETSDILKHNTTTKATTIRKQDIVKITSDFLSLVANFNKLKFSPDTTLRQLTELVSDKINAATLRHFKISIDNLRTLFNAYIAETNRNSTFPKLRELKNCLDAIFYLLQMTGSLLRFYEQHLNLLYAPCNIHKKNREELFALVNPDHLLYWTVEFGLNHVYILLNFGERLATKILNQNIEISCIKVGVPIKFGFHTRPSLLVAKIVQHYGSKVYLEVGNNKFDASSVLNIQWAGGKIQKEKICEVVFSGDTRALHDIKLLANINYGEDTMGKGVKMPNELRYLK